MSALIAGIDFSSKAIHCSLIPLDPDDGSDAPPVTLRVFEMPTWKGETTPAFRTVERCRVVRDAMRGLLADLSAFWNEVEVVSPTFKKITPCSYFHEVVHVCVETPLGSKSRSTVLWELYGAILASIPSHIERETIRTVDWRDLIWPGDPLQPEESWKSRAIQEALNMNVVTDEHQAEALLIATACRKRLDLAFRKVAS